MVHEIAVRGFGREAEAYERSRPSYPPESVTWLVHHLGIRPGAVVADLAAGPGKFTRLLMPTGATVLAIEPVQGMNELLHKVLPSVPIVAGTAEAMPIKSSSLDAVCAAQAFHWFDAEEAFGELARVLRPGGRVGFVWNARDRAVDWVQRVWAIMDDVEREAPWREHDNWRDSAFGERREFGPLHSETFRHEHPSTPAGIVDRIRGVSHVAVCQQPTRTKSWRTSGGSSTPIPTPAVAMSSASRTGSTATGAGVAEMRPGLCPSARGSTDDHTGRTCRRRRAVRRRDGQHLRTSGGRSS